MADVNHSRMLPMQTSNLVTWDYMKDIELSTRVIQQGQGTPGSDLDLSRETVALVKRITSCYMLPPVCALGIMGNLVSLVVLAAQRPQQPMNIQLMGLALCGMAYLLVSNLDIVSCILDDTQAASDFYTTTLAHAMWLSVLFSRITNGMTASIAWGRCLVVWFPLNARAWVTRQALYITTSAVYVITTLAHVPLFLRNEVTWEQVEKTVDGQKTNVTVARLQPTAFSEQNKFWLDSYKDLFLNVVFRLFPMLVVSFCTALILVSLKRQQRWRLAMVASAGSAGKSQMVRETRLTLTMVWLCSVFIVCSFPGLCLFTARLVYPQFDFYGSLAGMFEVTTCCNRVLETVNSAGDFFVYAATGDNFLQTCRKPFHRTVPAKIQRQISQPRAEIAISTIY